MEISGGLEQIQQDFTRSRDHAEVGAQSVVRGAGAIGAACTALETAAADTSDSQLQNAVSKLRAAHDALRDVAQQLPSFTEMVNPYLVSLGLPALRPIDAAASGNLRQQTPPATGSSQQKKYSGQPQTPYDVIAVLGSAYDFKANRFPEHVYKTLDDAAKMYNEGNAPNGIVVCGNGAMKDIARGLVAEITEAERMKRYLVGHGIAADKIWLEDQSTNTPENFLNFKKLALQEDWKHVYLPTAAPRVGRVAFLGAKICHRQCTFEVSGIPCETSFADEPKLLGDQVCALKRMDWGDEQFIPDNGGWNTISKKHHSCQFYVSAADTEPLRNYHPDWLMRRYGTPPAA